MTKPDDIPQDVWTAAVRVVLDPISPTHGVARAIMAEREACTQIIAAFPENLGSAKGRLVAAIRNRGAP